ncbi:Primary amine oxidase [Trichinella pseudospiralis]
MVKLMKQKKVKTRTTRSQSRRTLRRKRDEKRYGSEENSSENLDDRKWIADGTKQIKRRQEMEKKEENWSKHER